MMTNELTSKQLRTGNLTELTSNVLGIVGGTDAIIGSGVTIQVGVAGVTSNGYLTSTDWNTFNNKSEGGGGFRNINGRDIPSVFNGVEKMGAGAYEVDVSRTSWSGNDGLYLSTVALLNSNIFIAYDDDGSGKAGTIVTRSMIGTSVESATVFEAGETAYIDTTLLLNGNVAVSYIDVDDSNKLKFVIYDEDAVQIVAPVTVFAAQAQYTSITTLRNGNFLIACSDIDESNYGKFFIYSQAGAPVKFESLFTSVFTAYPSVATLTDGNIIFAYSAAGAGKFLVLSEDGDTTVVSETTFESGNSKYIKPVALTNGTFMIAYQDDADSDKGKRVVYSAGGSQLLAPTTFALVAVQQNYPVVLHNGNVLITFQAGVTGDMEFVILDVSGRVIQDRTIFDSDVNLKPVTAPVALINGKVFIPFADTVNRYVIWEPVVA